MVGVGARSMPCMFMPGVGLVIYIFVFIIARILLMGKSFESSLGLTYMEDAFKFVKKYKLKERSLFFSGLGVFLIKFWEVTPYKNYCVTAHIVQRIQPADCHGPFES